MRLLLFLLVLTSCATQKPCPPLPEPDVQCHNLVTGICERVARCPPEGENPTRKERRMAFLRCMSFVAGDTPPFWSHTESSANLRQVCDKVTYVNSAVRQCREALAEGCSEWPKVCDEIVMGGGE